MASLDVSSGCSVVCLPFPGLGSAKGWWSVVVVNFLTRYSDVLYFAGQLKFIGKAVRPFFCFDLSSVFSALWR